VQVYTGKRHAEPFAVTLVWLKERSGKVATVWNWPLSSMKYWG
jgi:hypothetical protein